MTQFYCHRTCNKLMMSRLHRKYSYNLQEYQMRENQNRYY